jgi:hypothetical protein
MSFNRANKTQKPAFQIDETLDESSISYRSSIKNDSFSTVKTAKTQSSKQLPPLHYSSSRTSTSTPTQKTSSASSSKHSTSRTISSTPTNLVQNIEVLLVLDIVNNTYG